MAWFNVYWIGALVTAYLLGSIPTAYLAGRIGKGTDIRQEGDRNPGAGNVYRVLGPKVGLLVAVVDIGKGALAVAVAKMVMGNMAGEMAAGTLAVAGHKLAHLPSAAWWKGRRQHRGSAVSHAAGCVDTSRRRCTTAPAHC